MKLRNLKLFFLSLFSYLVFISCHGQKSTKPPIIPIQNMVKQSSFAPQAPNDFFSDNRSTREPIKNTVAQGESYTDIRFDKGQEPESSPSNPNWVKNFPFKLDINILKNGQKNFDIYCAPCHGLSGHNDGLVTKHAGGSVRPAEIHSEKLQNMPVGQIYDAVTNGVNKWNMPGFSAQLNSTERWAIVTYVRALQLSEQKAVKPLPNLSQKKGEQK